MSVHVLPPSVVYSNVCPLDLVCNPNVEPFCFAVNLNPSPLTFHPSGIPLTPIVQPYISGDLSNTPFSATPFTQFSVHPLAVISVARHLI